MLVGSIPYSFQFRSAFSDNNCPVLDTNAYLFPAGKILTRKAAKKRASIYGTELGMRTLTTELEIPSKPKRSPSPCPPPAVSCSARLRPHGGRAQRPAHTPKDGGLCSTTAHRHGALTFVKDNLRELSNIQKSHKRNTKCTNSRITKCTEITSGFRSLQDADDWEAICPVLDPFLRHSPTISYYTVLKQMLWLDLTHYSLLVRQLISEVAAQGVLTGQYRQTKQKKIHENLFMALPRERPYHLEAIVNHR